MKLEAVFAALRREHPELCGVPPACLPQDLGREALALYPAAPKEESFGALLCPESAVLCRWSAGARSELAAVPGCMLLYSLLGSGSAVGPSEARETLPAGSGCLLSGEAPFALQGEAEWHFLLLHITGAADETFCHLTKQSGGYFDRVSFPDFESRLQLLLLRFPEAQPYTRLDLSCHLNHLLTRIVKSAGGEDEPERLGKGSGMMQVVSYLHAHLAEDITIEEVARAHHFSASYLRRRFREVMQLSPREYLTQIRLENARQLLRDTQQPVEEVARLSGFSSTASFQRIFKAREGLTPLGYRRLHADPPCRRTTGAP